jgi:histidinol phosphatase-like PHP family hydrolase
MYKYETHLHTSPTSACAVSTPRQQVMGYKELGYTGIIVTDHFVNGSSGCPRFIPWEDKMKYMIGGYEEAKKVGDEVGLDVFLGWEYSHFGTDFLTYGLGLDFLVQFTEMEDMTPREYCDVVHAYGGIVVQAHPFRTGWWIQSPRPVDPKLLDAIEVYNAALDDETNAKAAAFAKEYSMAGIAGTDCHHHDITFFSGITLKKKAETIQDIMAAIRARKAGLILP